MHLGRIAKLMRCVASILSVPVVVRNYLIFAGYETEQEL